MMMISHIVAASENNVIGLDGELPWNIPEDMKFFREKTKGTSIIMGRKTYESVGHPLPNRLNIVVTRNKDYLASGAHVVSTIQEGIEYARSQFPKFGEEIFIIGGGEIYNQSMNLVDLIYLTRIHQEISGDAYYPKIDLNKFEEIERRERTEPVPFSFLVYKKKEI